MSSWIGRRLGKYIIRDLLGRGGMGLVFRAEQEELGREVALKILPEQMLDNSPDLGKRFLREASVCAKLSHPHIVRIYDYGFEQGVYYYTMELLRATTIEAMLKAQPIQPLAVTTRMAREMLDAFAHYHPLGIVHRDLKPANIMVDAEARSILTDFGLVKDLGATAITREKVVVGTPSYIAPEMVRGQPVDAATDIWQLGVILYRMMTGHLPFEGETNRDVFIAIIRDDPAPIAALNPEVHKSLEMVVMNSLEKDREHRYTTAEEMKRDLEAALRKQPVGRKRDGPTVRPSSSTAQRTARQVTGGLRLPPKPAPRPSRAPAIAACVAALAIATGAALHATRQDHDAPVTQAPVARPEPPKPVPLPDPGHDATGALASFQPLSRAVALDKRLQKTPQRDRAAVRATESSEVSGQRLAAGLASFFPPDLAWPERTRRSKLLFDALAYDACHGVWGGVGPLGVLEKLAPLLSYEKEEVFRGPGEFPQVSMLPLLMKRFQGACQMTPLVVTQHDSDTFNYENVEAHPLKAVGMESILGTSDTPREKERIVQLVIPAGQDVHFAVFANDLDYRNAFLLRLRRDAASEAMTLPIVNQAPAKPNHWMLLVTRVKAGVIPPGAYTGELSAWRILPHEMARPNLRSLYLVTKKGT